MFQNTMRLFAIPLLLAGCHPEPLESPRLDPITTQSTGKPNQFRVCTSQICGDQADRTVTISPEIAADDLRTRLNQVISELPRSVLVLDDPEAFYSLYTVRSKVFGFPDDVAMIVRPGESGTEFAILSRSRYGRSDFGVNQSRVELILRDARIAGSFNSTTD